MQEKFSLKLDQNSKETVLLFFLCLLLIYPAIYPLLHPGFFPSMDGHLHIHWASQVKKALVDGHFPVRWGPDFFYGFGFPIFNFYSPLFHHLTALLTFTNLDFLTSAKIILILSFALSATFMFALSYEFWGRWGAAISAIAYIFAPYQFVDIYVRGAFPEFLTFPLLPLVFWSFFKLSRVEKPTLKALFFFLSSLSSSLLPLTHNFISLASLPFILLFIFVLNSQRRLILLFSLIFGLLLSSFFWLPTLFEKKYLLAEVLNLHYNFRDSFLYLHQLFYSPWGYGGNVKGPGDQMSFQIGFPHLILVVLSFFVASKLEKWRVKILNFSLFSFFLAILMTLSISIILWELIPFFSYAQFPWRFLTCIVFFASILSGSTVLLLPKGIFQKIFALLVIILIIGLNYSYARPKGWNLKDNDFLYTQGEIIGLPRDVVMGVDFTPRWVKNKPMASPREKIIPQVKKEGGFFKTHLYQFKIEVPTETKMDINTFYFPGWQVFIDGKKTKIDIPDTGIMQIKVPPGKHEIKVIFGETTVRKTADIISLLALLLLLTLSLSPNLLTKLETSSTKRLSSVFKLL